MQEPYLVPTECDRPLPGPSPALPFLSKSISSSSHQGKPYRTGGSTNRAPRPGTTTRGMRQVPAGGRSSERPLPGVKASALAAPAGISPAFPLPEPPSLAQSAWGPAGGRTGLPSNSLHHRLVPKGPRAGFVARGEKEWTRTRTTTLPPLNSSQIEIKCMQPSLQKAMPNSTCRDEALT